MMGKRSDNPLAPNYVPTLFPQLNSPAKRKLEKEASSFERRQATKRKRLSVQLCAANNKCTGKDDSTQGSNREKEGFACESEKDGTEAADIANNSMIEVCENAGNKELGNSDFSDSVDYEGDIITLAPICFEEISWTPSNFKCDFCDKMEEELFKLRQFNKQLESANKKLSPKVLSRESLRVNDAKA